MTGQFLDPKPESQLANTPLESMRRMPLFQEAIKRGLLSKTQPTPTKDTLILILSSGIKLSNDQIVESEKPVKVNLNDAHKEERPTLSSIPEGVSTVPVDEVEVLFEDDEESETPEQAYDRLSQMRFFSLKKLLKDDYGMLCSKEDNKATVLMKLKDALKLPLHVEDGANAT